MKPYSNDSTTNNEVKALLMREWYEQHRESFWSRLTRNSNNSDEFMLAMLEYARQVDNCEISLDEIDNLP